MNYGSDYKFIPATSFGSGMGMEVLPDLYVYTIQIVNYAPGHVSFFRAGDHALIAGDAFVTVKQESLSKVLTQEKEISGPPRYLTTEWQTALDSVKKLEALKPSIAITGHGLPMGGEELTKYLQKIVSEFDQIAIPDYGKYVN